MNENMWVMLSQADKQNRERQFKAQQAQWQLKEERGQDKPKSIFHRMTHRD